MAHPKNTPRNFRYGGCELGNRSLALSSLSPGPRASRAMDGGVLLSSYACGGARTPESRRTLRGPNACRNIRLKSSRDAQPLAGDCKNQSVLRTLETVQSTKDLLIRSVSVLPFDCSWLGQERAYAHPIEHQPEQRYTGNPDRLMCPLGESTLGQGRQRSAPSSLRGGASAPRIFGPTLK